MILRPCHTGVCEQNTPERRTRRKISFQSAKSGAGLLLAGQRLGGAGSNIHYYTGVCETNTPFASAFALQSCSRNCSPALDLVFQKLIFPRVLSGGVFFSQTPVSIWPRANTGSKDFIYTGSATRHSVPHGRMSRAKRPGVMTELLCYDLTNIPVPRFWLSECLTRAES